MSAVIFKCHQIAQSVRAILASADFRAPLLTSLVPTRGTGAPTFTRATTAYVSDYEGVLRQVLSGEARFSGARRVRNLLLKTEALNDAAWELLSGGTGTTVVVTSGFTDPNGGNTAFRIQANRGASNTTGDYSLIRETLLVATGGTAIQSAYVKSNTGSSQTVLFSDRGPGLTNITATPSWALAYRINENATGFWIGTRGGYSSDQIIDILVWHPQFEDITGRTDQTTPSEYVSVGVLSFPYHGAGVDGVKCFDTDLSGNVISSSTLNGYLAEGARTNLCLQSQVFDNASWVKSQTTVSTDATIAPDGTLTADKLVESATSGVEHYVEQIQSIVTNQTYAASFYVKAGELTQFAITIVAVGSTYTTSDILFAISAGVITPISGAAGLVSSSIAVPVGKGWYRCILIYTLNGTVTSHRIRIYPRQVGLYLGDITKGLYVWGAQLEVGPTATSYIPTTTAAVTRNADVLTYPSAGNILGTAGSAYAEVAFNGLNASTPGRMITVNSAAERNVMYNPGYAQFGMFDGTSVLVQPGGVLGDSVTRKYTSAWGGATMKVTSSGAAVTSGAFDGDMNANEIRIGSLYAAGYELNGNIRNVCIWLRKLPDAILKRISK